MSDAVHDVVKQTIHFPSHADQKVAINAVIWQPSNDVPLARTRGIVQIIHGMAEYIDRYDAFARTLVKHGYIVCGHDQFGHGASVNSPNKLGCLPAHGGAQALIDDTHDLRQLVQERLNNANTGNDLPYYIFGHSMGSFVARAYIAQHAQGLMGAVICGTGFVPPSTSHAGNILARLISKVRGEDAHSELLHSLADGSYSKKIPHAQTAFDWLSYNTDNVKAYIADDLCGYPFSAGGYATLTELTERVCKLQCAQAVPHDLPLLFIAGADDPVGDFGKGVQAAADLARQAGSTDVETVILDNMRHEILNEHDGQRATDSIIDWLDRHNRTHIKADQQ